MHFAKVGPEYANTSTGGDSINLLPTIEYAPFQKYENECFNRRESRRVDIQGYGANSGMPHRRGVQ